MIASPNRIQTIELIERLFLEYGAARYESGSPTGVSQLEHALQCAALAEHAGADVHLVSAALLHDLGHLLLEPGETSEGEDDLHQFRAMPFLRFTFPEEVLAPIRLHVDAKRFLCADERGYHAKLSAASQYSLSLQGGPFDADEAAAFLAHPFARDAILLRRWDDAAKVKGRATPPLEHFMFILRQSTRDMVEAI